MREYSVRNLVQMVDAQELVLPAMQRPFVWDEQRMVRLMDSLLRAFPLGSLLVWSTAAAQRYRPFARDARSTERPLENFPRAEGDRRLLYVLDGQQRLTTLCVSTLGTLDGRPLHLDVFSGSAEGKDPGDTYWDLRFLTGQQLTELNERGRTSTPRQHFVRFSRFLTLGTLKASSAALALARRLELDDSELERVAESYNRATATLDGTGLLRVHVIDDHGVTETPISEILEIFVRVNSGGLRLQKADLLMSLLDLRWENVQPALVRMANEISQIAPVDVTRDMLLKTALLIIGEDSRFNKLVADRDRVESIAPRLQGCIDKVERAWRELAILLRQDARILSKRFFRGSTRALLPFAVWLANNPAPSPTDKRKMVTALYIALMSGVFGSAEARMGSFARGSCAARGPFPLQGVADLTRRHRHVTSLDDLLNRHIDLALNIAHSGNVILDGNPDELERDHVFPRSTLRREGKPEALINHYANLHFLRGRDNRNKTNRPPHDWFRSPGRGVEAYTDEDMRARLLSYALVAPGRFEELIEVRGRAIRQAALSLFGLNEWAFDALFDGVRAADRWTHALKAALEGTLPTTLASQEDSLTLDLDDDGTRIGRYSGYQERDSRWLWCVVSVERLDADEELAASWKKLADAHGLGEAVRWDDDAGRYWVAVALNWPDPAALIPLLASLAAPRG